MLQESLHYTGAAMVFFAIGFVVRAIFSKAAELHPAVLSIAVFDAIGIAAAGMAVSLGSDCMSAEFASGKAATVFVMAIVMLLSFQVSSLMPGSMVMVELENALAKPYQQK